MTDEMSATEKTAPPAPAPSAAEEDRVPKRPFTLALDLGGTGLKGSVLDNADRMVADRVSVPTPYPLPPDRLVDTLADLIRPLPSFERVSVGFPGVVRKGHVLTAPQYSTEKGLGSPVVPELVAKWRGFPIADELSKRLARPTRVANDADLQGLAVVSGDGLEFVVTLGTGVGTALFYDGMLAPHLELAHVPFRKGETFNEQLGNATLERIGPKRWRRRVLLALEVFQTLTNFDHCYLGGGNARHLKGRLEPPYSVVDNVAGILGGLRLWDPGRSIDHRD